jgi:hypothetical protein
MNRVKRFLVLAHQRKANRTNQKGLQKIAARTGNLNSQDKTVGAGCKEVERWLKRVGTEWSAMRNWAGCLFFLLHLSPKYSSSTHVTKIKPKK